MMSWPIFIQTLRSYWITILIYAASLFGYSVLLASMYNMIEDLGDSYGDIIEQFPEGFMEAFGAGELASGNITFEGFISMEHLGLFWVIIVGAFIIGFAARALAAEVEQGTVALVLSQPVTRTKMFISKFVAGILGIVVLVVSSMAGIIAYASNADYETADLAGYGLFTFVAIIFFCALLSVCMLFSAMVNERGRAILLGMLFLVISFVTDLFARLQEDWEALRYISIFHYYGKPDETILTASFDDWHFVVLLGVIIVSVIGGLIVWNKRDISV